MATLPEMPVSPARPSRLRRLALWLFGGGLALVVLVALRGLYVFHDRYPGYHVALDIDGRRAAEKKAPLKAGFGRVNITPKLNDPAHPVWLAGFDQGKLARSIHDDLWAVALVLDDGVSRIGIVSLDAIGFFHDDVISVRRRLPEALKLDYTVVCATHNHSTPDLMGLWGSDPFHSGVDPQYRERVIDAAVEALRVASGAAETVQLALHEIITPPDGLVSDTRLPKVYDSDLRVLHFVRPADGSTVGTLTGWGNHPETPWSQNYDITADFPGVLRDALEHGIRYDGQVRQPGLGGVHLFVNGAVGGLMTTHPSTVVHDPFLERDFQEPSHDKTRALGHNLAQRILTRLKNSREPFTHSAPISVHARTLQLPLKNFNFFLAGMVGILDRGHSSWQKMRTEVAVLTVGDASMACIPGEIYPEIVNGGIVRAPGGDYDVDPIEIPPLRELMPGRLKFVFGLANDEIGYIIPKSEWDEQPPYLFHSAKRPYGEVNSLGPDTAHLLHTALRQLCEPQTKQD